MWLGHSAYLEITDGGDRRLHGADDPDRTTGCGYIAVDEIRMSNESAHPRAVRGRPTPVTVDLADVISALRAGRVSLWPIDWPRPSPRRARSRPDPRPDPGPGDRRRDRAG